MKRCSTNRLWGRLMAWMLAAALLFTNLEGAAVVRAEGEKAAPVEIGSAEDLQKIGSDAAYPMTGDYVLTEDIALIHGRPEQGVIRKQLAVTVVREPVRFSEDCFPVRLLIALAATDANSHLDVMQVLASIFLDESKIRELVEAESAEEIYEFLLAEEKERRTEVC